VLFASGLSALVLKRRWRTMSPNPNEKWAYSGRPPVGPQEPPRPMVNGRAIKGFDELALREALAVSEP